MIETSSWLLKCITKKWSIQGESLFLQEAYFLSIRLMNELFFYSAHMDGYQNSDLSYG